MPSNQTIISKFEILPNEILLEIFEFLSPVKIFEIFYYLNQRFSTLLLSLRLRIDLLNISKQMFDYYNHFLFPIASHCIISLRCEDIFDRLIHHIHLSEFFSLEYLTIINIKQATLKYIIPHLNKFQKLIYLNLKTSNDLTINELYFEQPMELIEKCILNLNKRIIIVGDQGYLNLNYLVLNQYHIDDLLSFIHIYTPKLRHLAVTLNDEHNSKKLLPKRDDKHHLESLVIKQCRIPFDRIEKLILLSLPYLKRLNINATGIDYANGKQWETLLSTSFPYLTNFELYTTFHNHDAPTPVLRTQLLKKFETTYFLSHNWYFAFMYHSTLLSIEFFSIPLFNNKFHVNLYDTYIEKTMNDINIFQNVNELSLFLTNPIENITLPKLSFNNVKHLKLTSRFQQHERQPTMLFVEVSHIVTFSKLESIEFIGDYFPSTSFILLDYTTKLQSISISFNNLIKMTKSLNDVHICQRLTTLIKHLTITSINDMKNSDMFKRLPIVFSHLESLSLSLANTNDLYALIILLLPKVAFTLKTMNVSVIGYYNQNLIPTEFMSWLIGYMHAHDFEKVDVKHIGDQMFFETSFPDEIILEICRYLHPIDILLAFCGLNYRLNRTITDFIHHVHLSSIISYENYLYLLRITLPSIWTSIQSLSINNCRVPCLTTLFLDNTDGILPVNLKRLSLVHLNTNEIYNFVNRLMNNCAIEELIIECTDVDFAKQQELYGYKIAQILFFRHPTLKSIEIRGDILFDLSHLSFLSLVNEDDSDAMSIANIGRSTILHRLTISLQSISSLCLLLIYQPHLEYLNVHIGDAKSTYDYTITPFPFLTNLHEFHFRSDDLAIKMEHLSKLLNYFPNLESLSLDLTTEDRSFFDGDILQTLVSSLNSFHYSLALFSQPTYEERTLSTFYTSFWLETKKWFTQCYWHNDEDNSDSAYFHTYSIPFPFSNFDVYQCTNENLISKEQFKSFTKVKRLDLSETSDVNIIPFLKRCPNVQTICLNDIYDDEENYGTDDEEDITTDQIDEISNNDSQTTNSSQSSLPILPHVQYLISLALPGNDLRFFECIVNVTPNLNRLSVYIDDLLDLIHVPQSNLCQLLQSRIYQLEIRLDYSWSIADIRRDIPKIIRIFSNIKSLTISFHLTQKRSFIIAKELLINLLKHQTNLICIHINSNSSPFFEQSSELPHIERVKTWLTTSSFAQFKSRDYLNNSIHIQLNSSSITIWL